jgi:uncharacterized membrane protein YtjA (UPF0391 family)
LAVVPTDALNTDKHSPLAHSTGAVHRQLNRWRSCQEGLMLYYAVVFFIIAIIAAVFGFGGIAAGAAGIAKILFVVFLILAIISFLTGRSRV